MRVANKDALLTIESTKKAGMRPLRTLQPSQMRVPFVKLPIKRASHNFYIAHLSGNGVCVRLGQNRICMMKKQGITGGELSAAIHLKATSDLIRPTHIDRFIRLFRVRNRRRFDRAYNYLVNSREPCPRPRQAVDFHAVVPRGDDDTDSSAESIIRLRDGGSGGASHPVTTFHVGSA